MAATKRTSHRRNTQSIAESNRLRVAQEVRRLLLLIVWPFIYFWPYLIYGGLTPGNDFHGLYFRFKCYLLDLLANGKSPPIWSPTEAAGFPFRANPFTASYYPLNTVLAFFYRLNQGYSESDHVIFTLTAFSIFAVGTVIWLRVLGEKASGAILAALLFATCVKMSELLRFPNAAHAAAWIPWLLAGVTMSFRAKIWPLGGAVCAIASYCLLTAGYPYYGYFSQFLIGPWVLLLLIPSFRRSLSERPEEQWVRQPLAIFTIFCGCMTSLVLLLPHLREMKQMLSSTTDRNGGNWEYSTAHDWTVTDILGSLVYPPRACTEGWYFFGVTALAVILLFTWEQLTRKPSPEGSTQHANHRKFLWLCLALWLVITSITLGRQSPVFYVLWKFYPGFSSLRAWSRMNVVLLPVLALVFARSWNWCVGELSGTAGQALVNSPKKQDCLRRLIWIGLGISLVQFCLIFVTSPEPYWLNFFLAPQNPLIQWRSGLNWSVMILSPLFIGGLALLIRQSGPKRIIEKAFGFPILLLLCSLETAGYGQLQWANQHSEWQEIRYRPQVQKSLEAGFYQPRLFTNTSVSLGVSSQVGIMDNWYFDRYVQFLRRNTSNPEAIANNPTQMGPHPGLMQLLGVEGGKRLFFVEHLEHSDCLKFVEAANEFEKQHSCRAEVKLFNGDQLLLDVHMNRPGFLCYIDNWDSTWKCRVNSKSVPIQLLMGTFKAVELPAGQSEVYFSCTDDTEPLISGEPSVFFTR